MCVCVCVCVCVYVPVYLGLFAVSSQPLELHYHPKNATQETTKIQHNFPISNRNNPSKIEFMLHTQEGIYIYNVYTCIRMHIHMYMYMHM